ncbi:aldo/keto reductase family protein [Desulfosporosinus nitroreducens]|uniref:Aldo/keto reductase n=1 Tax=Desulfosporosinus nitroreducens TaxID=2018668 RepID=A0ABT8QSK9_9FIRM|nr:aldo/keto reductase [Desulfosporosinus nitroreducens]MDO0824285.1 aldo/keto reductase [Desulfosporosinus nitroreducens]
MKRNVSLALGTMTFGESVFGSDVIEMIRCFLEQGYDELDTAYVYNEGQSEVLIGEAMKVLGKENVKISTKVNPRITGKLDGSAAYMQLNESLTRLGVERVHIFYLHFPDPNTPIDSVLEACTDLYNQGKFEELGLSNFPAELVLEVYEKCEVNGWIKPTVYEGVYNPLTRRAEQKLNAVLDNLGIRFYAYNPLAGGLLTGRYKNFDEAPTDGRFTHRLNYQKRYWKKSFFEASKLIEVECDKCGISMINATYRWLAYHSMLHGERGDMILIGASKLNHLVQNIKSINDGPLPKKIVSAFSAAWELCMADSPQYFTYYGTPLS